MCVFDDRFWYSILFFFSKWINAYFTLYCVLLAQYSHIAHHFELVCHISMALFVYYTARRFIIFCLYSICDEIQKYFSRMLFKIEILDRFDIIGSNHLKTDAIYTTGCLLSKSGSSWRRRPRAVVSTQTAVHGSMTWAMGEDAIKDSSLTGQQLLDCVRCCASIGIKRISDELTKHKRFSINTTQIYSSWIRIGLGSSPPRASLYTTATQITTSFICFGVHQKINKMSQIFFCTIYDGNATFVYKLANFF